MNVRRTAVAGWSRRFAGFAVVPALTSLSPLLLLPLLTRAAGVEGWAAIATGQAVGSIGATLVQFGWAIVGPAAVAGLDWQRARGVYFLSLLMRGGLLVVSIPLAILAVMFVVPAPWQGVASAVAVSACLTGLTCSWFFVGRGTPGPLLALEILPRVGGILLSAALLLLGYGPVAYAVTTLATELVIATVTGGRLARPDGRVRATLRSALSLLRAQAGVGLSGLLALGYTRGSVPIVAAVDFSSAAVFASADRMQSFARIPLAPFVQVFQKWVYDRIDEPSAFLARAVRASGIVTLVAALDGLVVALLLPPFSTFFFGPGIVITALQSALVGAAILFIGISMALSSFVLVPLGYTRALSACLAGASLVGVPSIWASAIAFAPEGPLAVIAGIELLVAVAQLIVAVTARRRLLHAGRESARMRTTRMQTTSRS